MGFWNGVTADSVASASDGFREFKIGDNEAYIKNVQEKVSESGNDMLVITFANDEDVEIRHYIVEGEFKQQRLKQLCIAFNIPFGSQNIQSWIGKRGIVVCKQGKPNNNGNIYNQVSYLRPKNPSQPTHNSASSNRPVQEPDRPPMEPGYMTPKSETQEGDPFTDDIPF